MSTSIALKLDKIKIKNINKIVKIPSIEKLHTKDGITLFAIKYFLFADKFIKSKPLVIRFTSIETTFNPIHSIELFDFKMRPAV